MNFWEKITGSDMTKKLKTFESRAKKLLHIPAHPDGKSGGIRTVNRKHPDTLPMI